MKVPVSAKLMTSRNGSLVLLSFLFISASFAGASAQSTAIATIDSFYKAYLNFRYDKQKKNRRPDLRFSKPFMQEVSENDRICKEYSTGICGFGADTDIYLDTQESDQHLNYANSGIDFSEPRKGTVIVTLNVYPSDETDDGYYDKKIIYTMIFENGEWVVNDFSYRDGKSWKARMKEENDWYLKHPDPDSVHMNIKEKKDK